MADSPLNEYFEALKRLESGTSFRVPVDSRISNDAVSLEAGKKKGSIKKSRLGFNPLIEAIAAAAQRQSNLTTNPDKLRLEKKTQNVKALQGDMDRVTGVLISRLHEVHELQKQLSQANDEIQLLKERLANANKKQVQPLRPV